MGFFYAVKLMVSSLSRKRNSIHDYYQIRTATWHKTFLQVGIFYNHKDGTKVCVDFIGAAMVFVTFLVMKKVMDRIIAIRLI